MFRFTKKRTNKIRKIKKKTCKRRRTRMSKRNHMRCFRKRGGAAPGGAKLPMIIDQNNITYSCTANPTA